ncbi:MAG: hypothetical protein ACOCXM_09280 [Myxococcota bacterium]
MRRGLGAGSSGAVGVGAVAVHALGALLFLCGPAPALAQDAVGEGSGADAKAAFRTGVEAARVEDWAAAARHFERSFEQTPRVAAAFNLIIAYAHLGEDAKLVRTADAMLEIADPERHRTQREQARALRERAIGRLTKLRLRVQPKDAEVTVDGEARSDRGEERAWWLEPGEHAVDLSAPDMRSQTVSFVGEAGEEVVLALQLQPAEEGGGEGAKPQEVPSETREAAGGTGRTGGPAETESRWRRGVTMSLLGLGSVGVGAGVLAQAMAFVRAKRLESRDPQQPGFVSEADEYRRWRAVSLALPLLGGLALSAAAALSEWRLHGAARWWVLAAGGALVATGAVLMALTPPRIGETRLTDPRRSVGSLLAGMGLPMMVAPVVSWLDPAGHSGGTVAAGPSGLMLALQGRWP